MSSATIAAIANQGGTRVTSRQGALAGAAVLTGRALYAAIFLMTLLSHFSPQAIGYAASQGLPMARLLVPASGVIAFLGGLSVLLGYRARLGAWLIVLFLVPVSLTMHAFWAVSDPMTAQMQMAMFMKNMSMLGAALMITQLGSGPMSLDARRSGTQVR